MSIQARMMSKGPAASTALVVDAANQHLYAPALRAEHVLRRHLAVFEHELAGVRAPHSKLVELLGGGEAGHALLDEKGGDAPAAGVRPVGDPHLGVVEDVAVALALGAGAQARHVRARNRGLAFGWKS